MAIPTNAGLERPAIREPGRRLLLINAGLSRVDEWMSKYLSVGSLDSL